MSYCIPTPYSDGICLNYSGEEIGSCSDQETYSMCVGTIDEGCVPGTCEWNTEDVAGDIMYVILKNRPGPSEFGQYIFDLLETTNQFPGRLTDSSGDLYTRVTDTHIPDGYKLRTDIGNTEYSKNIYLSNILMYVGRHSYSNYTIDLLYFDSECPETTEFFSKSGQSAHDYWGTVKSSCMSDFSRSDLVDYRSDANKLHQGYVMVNDIFGVNSQDYYFYNDPAVGGGAPGDLFAHDWYGNVPGGTYEHDHFVARRDYISDVNLDECDYNWTSGYYCELFAPKDGIEYDNKRKNFTFNETLASHDISGVIPISLHPGDTGLTGGDGINTPYDVSNIFTEKFETDLPSEQLQGKYYHVCLRGKGDNWSFGWYSGNIWPQWNTVSREHRIDCFKIPKSDFVNQWFRLEDYNFERSVGGSNTYNVKHYTRDFKETSTKYKWSAQFKLHKDKIAVGLFPPKKEEITSDNAFSQDSGFENVDPSSGILYGKNEFQGWIDPNPPHAPAGTTDSFRFYNPYILNDGHTYTLLDLTECYKLDGTPLLLSEVKQMDYRPIVTTTINDLEVQRLYDIASPEFKMISVPAVLTFSIDIGANDGSYFLTDNFRINNEIYTFAELKEKFNVKAKYFIADWGDDQYNEDNPFPDSSDPFPSNISALNAEINRGKFQVLDDFTEAAHTYYKPGPKTIVSYVMLVFQRQYSDGTLEEMVLKTKRVDTRVDIGEEEIFFPDHLNVSKGNFPLIPWFTPTAIIGGISKESDYFASVRDLANSSDTLFDYWEERFIKGYTKQAFKNDELGEHLGKVDIGQVRFFSPKENMNPSAYDLWYLLGYNDVLNVNNDDNLDVLDSIVFTQYGYDWLACFVYAWDMAVTAAPTTDWNSYYGSTCIANEYYVPWDWFESPLNYWGEEYNDITGNLILGESSMSKIFIDDISDHNLKRDCYLEYNFYDNDGIVVRDSSGNQNNGIIIGDFGLEKNEKEQSMGTNSSFKKPAINAKKDGVF